MILRGPTHAIPDRLGKAVVGLLLWVMHWHLSIVWCLVVSGRRRKSVVVLVMLLLLLLLLIIEL